MQATADDRSVNNRYGRSGAVTPKTKLPTGPDTDFNVYLR